MYNKPYDTNLLDWLGAACRKSMSERQIHRFWCSAFLAYILVQFGFLEDNVNWDLVRPDDLSSNSHILQFTKLCKYEKDQRLL